MRRAFTYSRRGANNVRGLGRKLFNRYAYAHCACRCMEGKSLKGIIMLTDSLQLCIIFYSEVLPLVTYVKWNAGACSAPSGETGSCLHANECQLRGGIAGGQCAGGKFQSLLHPIIGSVTIILSQWIFNRLRNLLCVHGWVFEYFIALVGFFFADDARAFAEHDNETEMYTTFELIFERRWGL